MPEGTKPTLNLHIENNGYRESSDRSEFYKQSEIQAPTIHIPVASYFDYGKSQYDTGVGADVASDPNLYNELRAQSQTRLDRWGNAIPRLVSKVGTEILKTPGYLYALGEAATTDDTLAEATNNAWLNAMQSFDNATKEKFAIYTPKAVRDGNLWDNISSASFWTNEGVDGAGFLISMMAPGAALKAAGIAGKLSKLGLSASWAQKMETGAATIMNTTLESMAETKGLVDNLKNEFQVKIEKGDINPSTGNPWTQEEANMSINESAKGVFTTNMALLLAPNYIMNKNLLGRFNATKSTLNKAIDEFGAFKDIPALTKSKILGSYAQEIGVGLFSEGFIEEAGQSSIENYYSKLAKGDTKEGLIHGLATEYANTLTSTEGQKAIFLGGFFGSLGATRAGGQLKQEHAYATKLSKMLKENFNGFSEALDGLYEKDVDGNVVKDEAGNAKVNLKRAGEIAAQIALENKSSQVKDVYGILGNKEMHDFITNQEFTRFAMPYLAEEGGLEALNKHIDMLSDKLVKNKKEQEGVDVVLDESKYRAEMKQKAKHLQESHDQVKGLIDNIKIQLKPEDEILYNLFSSRLKSAAFQEVSKQMFLSDRINSLSSESSQLKMSTTASLPQVKFEIEKLEKQIIAHQETLTKSTETYSELFDNNKIEQSFSEFKNKSLKKQPVVDQSDPEGQKKPFNERTYEDHLVEKNDLLKKIDESSDHNEIQTLTEQLSSNPLLEKDDIDMITKKFDNVKGVSIRKSQIEKQLNVALVKRNDVLGKISLLTEEIDTKSKDINDIVNDLYTKDEETGALKIKDENTSKSAKDKLFKLIDKTQKDIYKIQDSIDSLNSELDAIHEDINQLKIKQSSKEGIEGTKTELEHKNKEKDYLDEQIKSINEKLTVLQKIVRKLKQIFKSLFPNATEQLVEETGNIYGKNESKQEIIDAQKEITSKEQAIKELKALVKDYQSLREDIVSDIAKLNSEISEFEKELASTVISFETNEPVSNVDFIEITNDAIKAESDVGPAKKDVVYGITSTAGNNMIGHTNELTKDESQLRWFNYTSKMQVGENIDNTLVAISKNSNPFGSEVEFYDDGTILMVLHTDGKPVRVDGKLVYTSMPLPITLEQAKDKFTNKKNFTDRQIQTVIDSAIALRDRINKSKTPIHLKIIGKTKGIQVESNITSEDGKVIYRYPVFGRLTKNAKNLDDINMFVAKEPNTIIGSQVFETTVGMVYAVYDGQLVPLKVAKLGEIDGAVDTSIKLLKELLEIKKSKTKTNGENKREREIFDSLNLLFLYGNIKKADGSFLESDFNIFITKGGRLYFDGKYHTSLNEEALRSFLNNKYIRVSNSLLKTNGKKNQIKNPITGQKSTYKFYLLNNVKKASDQVLVGTSIVNIDKQQFLNVGLKYNPNSDINTDEKFTPKTKKKAPVVKKTGKLSIREKMMRSKQGLSMNPTAEELAEEEFDNEPELEETHEETEEYGYGEIIDEEKESRTVTELEEVKDLGNKIVPEKKLSIREKMMMSKRGEDPFKPKEGTVEKLNDDINNASGDTGIDFFDRTFLPSEKVATQQQLAIEERWFKTNFPQLDYERVRKIIGDGAIGRFISSGKVIISDLAAKGTTYHEAWHVVSQMFLTKDELDALYKDYRDRTGFNGTDIEVEELIAEDFRNYMLGYRVSFSHKIKGFFQSIVDFFKGLFKLNNSSLEDVFSNIKKGKYRSSKIISKDRYDLNRKLPGKSVEFTKDVIDSVNIFFFKNLLKLDDKHSFDDLFNLDDISYIYDKVYDNFMSTAKSHSTEQRAFFKDNYAYVTENWNLIIDEHVKSLEKYGVKIGLKTVSKIRVSTDLVVNEGLDVNDNGVINSENKTSEEDKKTTDHTYIDSIQFSSKDGMPKAVKLLLAGLPSISISNGKYSTDLNESLGTPKGTNYNKTIDFLHNKLAGSQSLDEMVKIVYDNIQVKPELAVLLKYLNTNLTEITPITLSDSQFNLQMKFYQQFAKNKNEYLTTFIDDDGNVYSFDSNTAKLGDKIKESWKSNVKDSINSSEGFYTLSNTGIISVNKQRVNAIASKYPLSNIRNAVLILNKFGINFSTDKFTEEEESLIKDATYKILYYAVNNDVIDIFQKDVVGTPISNLVNIEANYSVNETELQHINPEGKTVYGIALNTYLSLLVNDINKTGKINHINEKLNPYIKGSIWAKMIKEGSKIKLQIAEGLKSSTSNEKGETTSDLDMGSYLLQSLNLILNNKFPFLRAGDKNLEYVFDIPFDMNHDEYIKQMLEYYEDDAIRSMNLRVHGIGKDIEFYRKNALKSQIFEDITTIYPGDNIKDESEIKEFIKKNKKAITKAINEHLELQKNEFVATITKYGMASEKSDSGIYDINGINKDVLATLFKKDTKLSYSELMELAEVFTIKSMVSNIEQTKLFTGDMAFFNLIKGDFNKRTGGLTGPKKVANVDTSVNEWLNKNHPRADGKESDGNINVQVYGDVVSNAEYFDEYSKAIGEERAKEAYQAMKEADAQGYITLSEYKEFFQRSGEWTNKHELAYKKLIAGNKLTANEFQYFMPIKPMYFGPQTNVNGLYVPTYYKLSLMPLIPSMIHGRQLSLLNKHMNENKVGIAMFSSAAKVGGVFDGESMPSFYTNKGLFKGTSVISEINYKYLGIQLDIAPVDKRKVTFGTQFRKLILSNLFVNGISKTISVLRGGKMVSVDSKDVKKKYDDTINKLTSIKRAQLKEKLNLSPRKDGSFGISDIAKFKEVIINEAESRDIADNIIKSIEFALSHDNKFIDATISKNKIEQILYSLVNNNVISQNMFGDMKVMGSATGFEVGTRRFKQLDPNDASKIEWLSNHQTLKFYHKSANGSTSKMQVLLPSWFKEVLGDVSQFSSKELLELIGFRIPTQGLNSIDSIEVVGFLPKEAGNLIITPSEIVGKAGSDYDVDKLNVFFPNYIMVSGKPRWIPTNESGQKSLYEFIKESDDKYKDTFQEFLNKYEEQILQNSILDIAKEVLSSPEMFDQLITPNSVTTLKNVVKSIRNDMYGSESKERIISGTKILQWLSNAQTALSFWSGKAGVGIAALHNTSHILAQQAGLYLTPEAKTYIKLSHNSTKNGDIDLSSEYDSNGKIRISDIINQFVNAYVDIAKDPFVFDMNAGVQTANVWLYLVRAGVPVETIGKFMRQPIIWDYVTEQSINESTLSKSLGKEISKSKLEAKLRNKYGFKDFKKDQHFSFKESDLGKYLSKKAVVDKEYNIAQQAILTDFLEYQRMGSVLGKMMQYTNADTKGAGKNRNAARILIEGIDEIAVKGVFGNFNKYTNDSILKEFIQTVREAKDYYNELFITDNENVRDVLNTLKNQFQGIDESTGVKSKDLSMTALSELMDLAENELINYIIQTVPQNGEVLANKIDELFRGKNSVAFRLLKAKKDEKLKDNLFIESMFPLISNNRSNIDNIKQFSKRLSVYESNQLTEAYMQLYDTNPGLADDITKLGILQSGMSNSPISFLSVIPAEKFFELASQSVDLVSASENVNLENFIDLFYQNNFGNSKVVKQMKGWKFTESGIASIVDGVMTFNKTDPMFENEMFLKTITVNKSSDKKTQNEMKSKGEVKFITRLFKKTGEGVFTEVPTKGEGMFLRDYRKTDNIVVRKPAVSNNKGKATTSFKSAGIVGQTFTSESATGNAINSYYGKKVIAKPTDEYVISLKPEAKKVVGNEISSNSKGLSAVLTNPTELAKSKGNINKSYPVKYKGKVYKDAEAAYQDNKHWGDKTDPNPFSYTTYDLMVDIIKAKLEQYPEIVNGINSVGGSNWILNATHQPTKQNNVWETGGKNWFIKALNEAYLEVVSKTKTDNKLQVEEKNTILSSIQLLRISLKMSKAGLLKNPYTMEQFNQLTEKEKQQLIKCYL